MGGVCIGITTSGASKNVINALKMAKEMGMTAVALIGEHTETIAPYADHIISVPSSVTSLIQQAHLVIYHYLCGAVEKSVLED
jgi:D-sedoheptulose 7-phosphate isomerase